MKHSHDLTTGPLTTHFRTLAVPAAIGMVFNTLYNVVDVFFQNFMFVLMIFRSKVRVEKNGARQKS